MDAVKAYATGELTKAFESIGISAEDAWKSTVSAAKWALNYMIGFGTIAHRTIIAGFQLLPGAIGDAFYSAANLALTAIEKLVNGAIKGIALAIATANPLLAAAGMAALGGNLPQVSLGRVSNPYAGGAAKFGGAVSGAVKDTFTRDFIGEFSDYVSPYAEARARDRLKGDAKKAGKESGKAGGKAAADDFADTFNKALDSVFAAVDKQMQAYWENYPKQTESDLYDIRAASNAEFETTYKALNAKIGAQQRWNDELVRTADLFGQIGGAGQGIASVLNILAGNYGAVNGPLGAFTQSLAMLSWKDKDGNILKLGEEFTKALDGVFGQDGRFLQALKGSELGAATGTLLFGNNSGAQIGGAIGGAVGSFLGPIGNVVGSVIGSGLGAAFNEIKPSLLGGIFGGILGAFGLGSAKYGTANVTGLGAAGIKGNAGQYKDNAGDAAASIQDILSNVADTLGGSVGGFNVSIGQYKGKWRVSPGGMTGKLNKGDTVDFGKDGADDAIKFAIADAIKDGAIQGVSAAVGRLLQGGGDIDKQVQKAQLFQGVFSELKAQTDPLGAALDGVAKQFDALRKIFDEAGASTEEYASLEQLLALKRQDAIDAARQSNVDKISDQFNLQIRALELMGKGESALAATRLLELAGLKDTLQPIQRMVYELEDARAVIDQFAPLADGLREYRKELLGTSSVASLGAARALFSATAASAAMGDAAALGNLRGVSTSFLDSAKANARSSLDYNRARGQVLSAVDQGIFAADTKVDYAQAQIDAINNSAQILEQMRAEMASLQGQIASNTAYMANLWKRFDGEGMTIRTDADQPLQVEIAA